MKIITYYLIIINVVAFVLYGIDKVKAKHNAWRISEATLLLSAALGGPVGALLGMQVFRHKTKHKKFIILVPLFIIVWAFICYYLFFDLKAV